MNLFRIQIHLKRFGVSKSKIFADTITNFTDVLKVTKKKSKI